jgi:hypothetical protein
LCLGGFDETNRQDAENAEDEEIEKVKVDSTFRSFFHQ